MESRSSCHFVLKIETNNMIFLSEEKNQKKKRKGKVDMGPNAVYKRRCFKKDDSKRRILRC